MICTFGIYFPDISLGSFSAIYIFDRFHGRKHGMIHIVIPVHAVSANGPQIRNCINKILNLLYSCIGAKIGRIGFGGRLYSES